MAGLAGLALLAACADNPPPRMAQAPAPQMMPAAPPPTPAPAPAPMGDGRTATLRLEGDMLSDADRAQLSPIVERLQANRRATVTIATHAGREDRAAARTRAQAVRAALVDAGVPANRIRTVNAQARGMSAEEVMLQVR
jgi:outer membrane protein OmpA-like peptidoglycan-associated protein